MAIDVKIELKNKKIDISQFKEAQIRRASMRGINQAMAQVKTMAVRQVTKIYNLSASDVRPNIFVLKASESNLTGKLLSSKRTIPLLNFNPTEIKAGIKTRYVGSRKKGGLKSSATRESTDGIKVSIFRENAAIIKYAFIFQGSGNRNAVKAVGEYDGGSFTYGVPGQSPTTRINSLSIAAALRNEQINKALASNAAEIYAKTYLSQLENIGKY